MTMRDGAEAMGYIVLASDPGLKVGVLPLAHVD